MTGFLLAGLFGATPAVADEIRLNHAPQVAKEPLKWRPARTPLAAQAGEPGTIRPTPRQLDSQVRPTSGGIALGGPEANEGPALLPTPALIQTSSSGPSIGLLPPRGGNSQVAQNTPQPTAPAFQLPEVPAAPSAPTTTPGALLPVEPMPTLPEPTTPPVPAPLEPTTPAPALTDPVPPMIPMVTPPDPLPINPNSTPPEPLPPTRAGDKPRSTMNQMQDDCDLARNKAQEVRLTSALGASILNLASSSKGEMPFECTLSGTDFSARNWQCLTYTWKASALCHKPLYFEQVAMERYGHSWGPIADPLIGAAHFFGTLPILPYKMGVDTPCECEYALGYYRPGNCAPYMIPPFPISGRGALVQAGAVVGAAAVIP